MVFSESRLWERRVFSFKNARTFSAHFPFVLALRGFGRYWKSLGGSGMVWKALEGSAGFERFCEALGGFERLR